MAFWKRKVKKGKKKVVKKAVRKVKAVKRPVKKKKAVKKKVTRKVSKKEDKFEIGFEEVVVKCPSCGREFRVVKSSHFNMEGMLCQRCAAGGGIGFEADQD